MATTEGPGQGTPGAGWYADPEVSGRQRYWDGSRWTEQVSELQAAAPQHVQPAAAMTPTSDASARQWALFAHLSALLALFIGLPFVGPLVIYLVKKDDHPFIADQAREALNFNLSVFIYEIVGAIAAVILTIVLIGLLIFPVLIAIAIAWLVLVIVAAVKANGGEAYRYPLTIRMVS